MRQHLQQRVHVTNVGSEDDSAPGLVDADGPEPWVAGVGDLLQVQSGMGGGVEFVEDLGDPVVDGLLELSQVFEEPFVDGEWHYFSVA
nr:hypothetical protein [Mycobacterium colombiense]